MARRLVLSLAVLVVLLAGARAHAKKMTLPELLDLARTGNPGLHANAAVTEASQAQVSEAWTNWLPSGDILSLLAPSPRVQCRSPGMASAQSEDVGPREQDCTSTTAGEFSLSTVSFSQVFTRTEVRLIQPLWDFGKISAGLAAARAGVGVSREREAGARADVELNVRKAYYGIKLARELIATLEEGSGYVDDGQKRIEGDLAKGVGNSTVTDKLRLRTVRAEVDARLLEAKRLEGLARAGLRASTSTSTTTILRPSRSRTARSATTRTRRASTDPRFVCWITLCAPSVPWPISSAGASTPTWC
jgi:outer membrane protein TolC